jgi:hypothetical protein
MTVCVQQGEKVIMNIHQDQVKCPVLDLFNGRRAIIPLFAAPWLIGQVLGGLVGSLLLISA